MEKWTVIICQVTFSKLTLMSVNQTHPHRPNFNNMVCEMSRRTTKFSDTVQYGSI